MDPGEWAAGLAGRNDLPLLRAGDLDPGMLDDLAAVTLATVGSRRATFTRANLLAEAARQLHGARFATAEDRVAVVGSRHRHRRRPGRPPHVHPRARS